MSNNDFLTDKNLENLLIIAQKAKLNIELLREMIDVANKEQGIKPNKLADKKIDELNNSIKLFEKNLQILLLTKADLLWYSRLTFMPVSRPESTFFQPKACHKGFLIEALPPYIELILNQRRGEQIWNTQ